MLLLKKSPEHKASVDVVGVLRYQACDDKRCFAPCETPVAWDVRVHPLDFEETDPALRKPPK